MTNTLPSNDRMNAVSGRSQAIASINSAERAYLTARYIFGKHRMRIRMPKALREPLSAAVRSEAENARERIRGRAVSEARIHPPDVFEMLDPLLVARDPRDVRGGPLPRIRLHRRVAVQEEAHLPRDEGRLPLLP